MKIKDGNNAAIGERIKEIRLKQNMTQETLAEKVNLGSAQQISDIERGLCGLSVSKLIEFCKVLTVDADYLLFGTATRDAKNPLNRYFSQMTPEQSRCAENLVSAYAKSCNIN
ncbi:MAG: helix-turn-helix transcriptional regulator [Clostridia bacterium]|nr:helix-turn-helix transcriptional regulator [Clostridia bacterium]